MNINITVQCETCEDPTNLRIGLSGRDPQPFEFHCQTCTAPISITIWKKKGAEFSGAKQIPDKMPFDDKMNFVDLHLDFPVSFDKYVMGNTPFMMAVGRVTYEDMVVHQARLKMLDDLVEKAKCFSLILKLFRNEKWAPFKTIVERNFFIRISKNPMIVDYITALYLVIGDVMAPFVMPSQDGDVIKLFTETIEKLGREHQGPTEAFMKEILDKKLLKNLQLDCLDIYPKVLAAEIPLRPALFLDFDKDFKDNPIPMRVSSAVFETYKDLYKDISEIISRQFILVAGINNLLKRDDHDVFLSEIDKTKSGKDFTPKSLHNFGDVAFGKKLDYIDDSWFELMDHSADNQLRNAIAHYKTEYDEVTQTLTYYPRMEGMKQEKAETISFLVFMRRLLISYREMHRLHHLIKCLFYLQYNILDHKPGATGA